MKSNGGTTAQSIRLRIGMLGSGTVGEAIQDLVFAGAIHSQLGMDLEIVKIYTRHPKTKKWYRDRARLFTTDPEEVINHRDVDVVVEVLGSQDRESLARFRDYIIAALEKGRAVVTSDKAVLARFGKDIWEAARRCGREVRFEACVGGGIPIIRALAEGLVAEEPEAIYGVVNGTSNYILSAMEKGAASYAAALADAQKRGYAETDPRADVSGEDAEAKLVLLAQVTFGLTIKPGSVWRKGIDEIDPIDFRYAAHKGGLTIKPVAVARKTGGEIAAFVCPMLVPRQHFLAAVAGATNAIFFKGKRSEDGDRESCEGSRRDWNYIFVGPGAGGGPTAMAVLGDICDVGRGRVHPPPKPPSMAVAGKLKLQAEDRLRSSFYIRFVVRDRAGIVGDICQALGREGINVAEIWQLPHGAAELTELASRLRLTLSASEVLPFVITLEETTVGQVKKVVETVRAKEFMLAPPVWFPIWSS